MAIKFTPKYNERIKKVVSNYNRRVRQANKEGKIRKDKLPQLASVYDLKHNYTSKEMLDKELANLEAFTRESTRTRYNTALNQYEKYLVTHNRKDALEFFEHKLDMLQQNFNPISLKDEDNAILYQEYIKVLKNEGNIDDIPDATSQLMERAINQYRVFYNRQGAGYRGFMSEVEWIMDNLQIPKSEQTKFFNKLRQLTPDEFYDVYMENDLIEAIYMIAESDPETGGKLNTTQKHAQELIDSLMDEVDTMVAEAKAKRKK